MNEESKIDIDKNDDTALNLMIDPQGNIDVQVEAGRGWHVERAKEKDTINLLREESETMWLTDQFVMKPCSVLIVGYAILVLLTYMSV